MAIKENEKKSIEELANSTDEPKTGDEGEEEFTTDLDEAINDVVKYAAQAAFAYQEKPFSFGYENDIKEAFLNSVCILKDICQESYDFMTFITTMKAIFKGLKQNYGMDAVNWLTSGEI